MYHPIWNRRRLRRSWLSATSEGQRDHALLSFLYNTGARIQEALEIDRDD